MEIPEYKTKVIKATKKPNTEIKSYSNLYKLKVVKNHKVPAQTGWDKIENLSKTIDTNRYNVGIAAGENNDIIVLDIDDKGTDKLKNGMTLWNEYIAIHGEPETVKQLTVNGGYHYIFKLSTNDKDKEFLIKKYLKTRKGLMGYSIDIRNNGGYIVAAPSTINGKTYTFENGKSFDDIKPIEMPDKLLSFLLGNVFTSHSDIIKLDKIEMKGKKKPIQEPVLKLPQINKIKNKLIYDISDELLTKYLYYLDASHCDEYDKWVLITTICRNLNKFEIWDEWSTQSEKYNRSRNISIWNGNKGIIDVNYLITILNNKGYNLKNIQFYKKFRELIAPTFKTITYHNKYVFDEQFEGDQLTYDHFKTYDTILLKACTGTGKTTAISKHLYTFLNDADHKDKNYKFMSITDNINLTRQHKHAFKKEKINLISYDDTDAEIYDNNLTICLNSIIRYQNTPAEHFKNYIIYIDEVNSVLKYTKNETILDMKNVSATFYKIINNAYKVIVSDATITDAVKLLLNNRCDTKKIYFDNTFKKYQGVKANRILSEQNFLNDLQTQYKINKPFLMGTDSATIATQMYNACVSIASEEDKHKFILITAKTNFNYTDANEQFKDKYVFYSPKIRHGIDFSIFEPQNVYIYIHGRSIDPMGIFQQTTRTRNIDILYYYSHLECKEPIYDTLQDVKNSFLELTSTSKIIHDLCTVIDINDNLVIVDNKFLNIEAFNEFSNDAYGTNKVKHFELILIENGFELSTIGETERISKTDSIIMRHQIINNSNELFEAFINSDNRSNEQFELFNKNIDALQLGRASNEQLIQFKDIIIDEFNVKKSFVFDNLQKVDEFIIEKVMEKEQKNYSFKCFNSPYHKINILRKLLKDYNIKDQYTFDYSSDKPVSMDVKIHDHIKKVFRITKPIPQTMADIQYIHLTILKHLTAPEIVIRTRKRDNKKFICNYELNNEYFNKQFDLIRYRNPNFLNYKDEFIEHFNLISDSSDPFTDD